MCGIAAVYDFTPTRERAGQSAVIGEGMLCRLRHRGPDGTGTQAIGETAWLGHARLSIVDVAGGQQPLSLDGSWVVVNGEIYNHAELRRRLGGVFATQSDSEIVLHIVGRRGPGFIHDMKGMYAFAFAAPDGAMVLGRDPLGVKPLYWARHEDRLLVASELGAFPYAARAAVEEFPPGHYWTSDTGLVSFVNLRANPLGEGHSRRPMFTEREVAKTAIREAVVAAVKVRMMADVPVGVFLSGGLDSSIVAAIMAREHTDSHVRGANNTGAAKIQSFAAGVPGSPDLAAARVVAQYLGLDHHERVYTDDDVIEALPTVVRSTESYEPSLIRSAVPNYLLAEMTAQHVKVVLTGEGADELFAGYHHMRSLSPDQLREALIDGVETLHHLNLQRCDRVTMAHGLEARVPFLAREMLDVAGRVPVEWKLLGEDGQEKALLREAFEGWLPREILWRRKEQFGDGSGTADVMTRRAEQFVPDEDWESIRIEGLPAARSREELGYQRIFDERLGGIRAEQVLGRFATA